MATGNNKELKADVKELMSDYLNICNKIIEKHKDKALYRSLIELNEKVWDQMNFKTYVYDEHPDNITGEFIINYNAEEKKVRLLPPGEYDIAFSYKTPLSYLHDVVEVRPSWYKENPMMLDWAWMKHRTRSGIKAIVKKPDMLWAGAIGFFVGAAAGALSFYLLRKS